jgi:hypothetical protein
VEGDAGPFPGLRGRRPADHHYRTMREGKGGKGRFKGTMNLTAKAKKANSCGFVVVFNSELPIDIFIYILYIDEAVPKLQFLEQLP